MKTCHKSVHFKCCFAFLFLFAVLAHGADKYRFRTWVDSSGQLKIEAQYQRIKDNKVVLSKLGDGDLEIELSMLSERDREYVRLTNRGMEPTAEFEHVTKAQSFVIDITKGETIYRHAVKYP